MWCHCALLLLCINFYVHPHAAIPLLSFDVVHTPMGTQNYGINYFFSLEISQSNFHANVHCKESEEAE